MENIEWDFSVRFSVLYIFLMCSILSWWFNNVHRKYRSPSWRQNLLVFPSSTCFMMVFVVGSNCNPSLIISCNSANTRIWLPSVVVGDGSFSSARRLPQHWFFRAYTWRSCQIRPISPTSAPNFGLTWVLSKSSSSPHYWSWTWRPCLTSSSSILVDNAQQWSFPSHGPYTFVHNLVASFSRKTCGARPTSKLLLWKIMRHPSALQTIAQSWVASTPVQRWLCVSTLWMQSCTLPCNSNISPSSTNLSVVQPSWSSLLRIFGSIWLIQGRPSHHAQCVAPPNLRS